MTPETKKSRPLTEEQSQAIAAQSLSVALSAGAGCGKTFVLTERFLRELEPSTTRPPASLGQIVAITFTERAAREMRERIHSACVQRLLICDETEVHHWLRWVREIDAARISTIHAFCGTLLRSYAVEAGLVRAYARVPALGGADCFNHAYPFNEPTITPLMKYFWMNGYTKIIGPIVIIAAAA